MAVVKVIELLGESEQRDRKSTRLNSSHANISYAVFCLKKKNNLPSLPLSRYPLLLLLLYPYFSLSLSPPHPPSHPPPLLPLPLPLLNLTPLHRTLLPPP